MKDVHLTDPDLQSWLLGSTVAEDLAVLSRGVAALLGPGRMDEAWWEQCHAGRVPGDTGTRETLEAIYRTCPRNLAERLHEGLNVYWVVGERALPPLLPLLNPMVQAELHLYTKLDLSGKPYREHIVHTTRVAALAHLFLAAPEEVLLPKGLRWENLRFEWSRSYEFHLLRRYAVEHGLTIPDPALEDDPWRPWVRIAALLSGLIHDLGYLHKGIGEVAEKAAKVVPWMSFTPEVKVPDADGRSPLGGLYRAVFEATEHGQVYASLPEFLRRNYRPIHSVVGALWLACLAEELRPCCPPQAEGSMAELAFQLAAMMAFAHDLSLSDGKRRKLLGMRQVTHKDKKRDVVNRWDFPLCTLFSLADVFQEFGRPVQVVVGDTMRYWVPVAGIGLSAADDNAVELKYLTLPPTPPRRPTSLLPTAAVEQRGLGAWDERYVGLGVVPWLEAAGLEEMVRLKVDEEEEKNEDCLDSYKEEKGVGFSRKLVT